MNTNTLKKHYDKLGIKERFSAIAAAAARKDYTELDALRSAVMPVVEWYIRSKEKFPVDFVENSPVLEYANQGVVESVTGAQLDVLAKLVREL